MSKVCYSDISVSSSSLQLSFQIQPLPPIHLHYESPRTPTQKQWTDQTLLSTENIDTYLAESDAFQRASFASIIQRWKEHDQNKTHRMISSFDDRYNMKIRFRHDDQLNRSSEKKYAPMATYYRYLGNENNAKNARPCARHKRRTQAYQDRHVKDLLKLPAGSEHRERPYLVTKKPRLPRIGASSEASSVRLSVSFADESHQTFS